MISVISFYIILSYLVNYNRIKRYNIPQKIILFINSDYCD
jgi:hypothetical protein